MSLEQISDNEADASARKGRNFLMRRNLSRRDERRSDNGRVQDEDGSDTTHRNMSVGKKRQSASENRTLKRQGTVTFITTK